MIRIGTRGSKLALWQANWVSDQLKRLGFDNELVIISTTGDVSSRPLSEVGGQGLFTKEIQRELLDRRVDVAVHSLKDLPTVPVPGLHLAAVPERESTEDCLISAKKIRFEELPAGSRIGTGSSRRQAQLRAWRQDLSIVEIRGNVDSRLKKLDEGLYDAIVLAAAGLSRLELSHVITQRLPQDKVLPAVGQGALGLECRADDPSTTEALVLLNHAATYNAVLAERSLMAGLLAGCLAPVAAQATVTDQELYLQARVLSLDGTTQIDGQISGPADHAVELGQELAHSLSVRGAAKLIETMRTASRPSAS